MSIEALETSFTEKTFRYKQIDRQGDIALFTQTSKGVESGAVRYEVVVIEIKPPYTFPNGISYPEREGYPSASQWGRKGFSCFTEAGAREKMRWLQHSETEDRTDEVERQTWKQM